MEPNFSISIGVNINPEYQQINWSAYNSGTWCGSGSATTVQDALEKGMESIQKRIKETAETVKNIQEKTAAVAERITTGQFTVPLPAE